MNEVESVYDASLSEPTQLEIDCAVFKAWTQGIKVPELVSALKSALLDQYELDASAAGSGYANIAQYASESSSSSSSSDDDAPMREDDLASTPHRATRRSADHAAEEDQMQTPKPRNNKEKLDEQHEDSIANAVAQHIRRADAAGLTSSDEEEQRPAGRTGLKGSRRNSGDSISGTRHRQRSQTGLRSTPHAPFVSPGFGSSSKLGRTGAHRDPNAHHRSKQTIVPTIPTPSSIEILSSTQAHARLLWAWETQLEHQYRLFTLLEHSLRKPFLLNLHYCILQLSFQIQLQLTNLYYDFDTGFMRHLMGQKLSATTRGGIEGMLAQLKEERASSNTTTSATGSQRRQPSQPSSIFAGFEEDEELFASSTVTNEPTRYSSACRQFDNLRRIYRCRWGEKGDGVIGETDLRLDDLEVTGTGIQMPGSWKNMRAAAVAAMAKGFGVGSPNPVGGVNSKATPNTAIAPAVARHRNTLSDPAVFGTVASSTSGSLDDFFGFDSSSQPMRLNEQTAPIFFQQQFRLTSTLARRYARLVFLAHYRIEMPTKRRKERQVLDFGEVELIAQILMRCWAIPVGQTKSNNIEPEGQADHAANSDTLPPPPAAASSLPLTPGQSVRPIASSSYGTPALASGAPSSMPGTTILPTDVNPQSIQSFGMNTLRAVDNNNVIAQTINPSMFAPPGVRMLSGDSRRRSIDDDTTNVPPLSAAPVSAAANGAAASGFEFLPIVAQMQEHDEDVWVGDVLDAEFIEGLRDLKTHFSSRLLDEYVTLMIRHCRDTHALQVNSHLPPNMMQAITGQQWSIIMNANTTTNANDNQTPTQQLRNVALATPVNHAATLPTPHHHHQPSGSSTSHTSATGFDVPSAVGSSTSSSSGGAIRSSMLLKVQSKLQPWLKSLHSIAISLGKSKRIRSLVTDLQDEILKPLWKLGWNVSEVMYIMKILREKVGSLSTLVRYDIPTQAKYPCAYERQGGTFSLATAEPLHRAFLHWCRFLDAIGPISIILYIKMTRNQEQTERK